MNYFLWYVVIGAGYAGVLQATRPGNVKIVIVRFLLWWLHAIGFLLWRFRQNEKVSCENAGHFQIMNEQGEYICKRCKMRRSTKPIGGQYLWVK